MRAQQDDAGASPRRTRRVARDALVFWGIGALLLIVLVAVRAAAQPLLLTFAGVLFGTALRGAALALSRRLGWREGWSLAACVAVLVVLAAASALWIGAHLPEQLAALGERLQESYGRLRELMARHDVTSELAGSGGDAVAFLRDAAGGFLMSGAGFLGALLFVFFVALFVASSPRVYRRGALQLVPPARRARAGQILDALASTLRRWLGGRVVSMAAVGAVTTLGLWLLDIPLPVTLGGIAGLLGFVPNLGPIVSVVPAALIALTVSPLHVVYVVALYLAVNLADGYALTPWLQQRAVSVPPALLLTGQIVAGALWGLLGVTFATPLLACTVVLVRSLYVEGVLER